MRTALLFLLTLFGLVAAARANVLTVIGADSLQPNTPNQEITILLSGSDFYSDSTLSMSINSGMDGPRPLITSVFGKNKGEIPVASLANSVWVNGLGAVSEITGPPPGHWGQGVVQGFFVSPDFGSINNQGLYAVFTISTVGVPAGAYYLSLAGTTMFNGLDENADPIPVPLTLPAPILLGFVVPEPSTYLLAAMGVVALLTFKRHKRST